MVKKNKKTNTGQVNLKGKDADVVVHTSNPVFGKQEKKRAMRSDCLSSIPARATYESPSPNTRKLQGHGDWCILGLPGLPM